MNGFSGGRLSILYLYLRMGDGMIRTHTLNDRAGRVFNNVILK